VPSVADDLGLEDVQIVPGGVERRPRPAASRERRRSSTAAVLEARSSGEVPRV
jgi:hypothetical protein